MTRKGNVIMKALLIPVGEMPREIEINGYDDLKKAVGGYIDAAGWIFDDYPTIYVNDEGKFSCSPNRAIYATEADAGKVTWDGVEVKEGDLIDIIYGDFVAIGFDRQMGEDRDISDEEIERVMERFGTEQSIESGIIEALRIKMGRNSTAW